MATIYSIRRLRFVDPETLATIAATLVATKAAEAAGSKVGEGAWSGVTDLYQALRAQLSKNREALHALDRVSSLPVSDEHVAELTHVLEEELRADPEWAAELEQAVAKIPGGSSAATVQGTDVGVVALGGVTQVGHNVAGRDLTIREGSRDDY